MNIIQYVQDHFNHYRVFETILDLYNEIIFSYMYEKKTLY